MLRPEQLRLSAADDGLPARVEEVIYYGHDCRVTLAVDGAAQRLTALVPGFASPHPGEIVGLRVEGTVVAYPRESATAG
jgi:iron(III) transport system ATP-binding protein